MPIKLTNNYDACQTFKKSKSKEQPGTSDCVIYTHPIPLYV